MPARRVQPQIEHNACRVHGTLTLNKVAGNFHVTAGKVLPIMGAHAHMTGFMEPRDYNFTHRIEKLSFGDKHAGIIQPLEGDEKITDISERQNIIHSHFDLSLSRSDEFPILYRGCPHRGVWFVW